MNKPLLAVTLLMTAAVLVGCGAPTPKPTDDMQAYKPELLVQLPEYCNNPDGLEITPDGKAVLLTIPNFVHKCKDGKTPRYPGLLMKLDHDGNASLYYPLPVSPRTGRCGPMAMRFGPDGNLYIADNQYFMDKEAASRVIRVNHKDGKPVSTDIVVEGTNLSNAIAFRGREMFISDTFLDIPGENAGGVYRVTLDEIAAAKDGCVQITPGGKDKHLIAKTQTVPNHREDTAGADGLTFDSKGNLYTDNFGDGKIYKISFNADGTVKENKVLISDPKLQSADGLFCDLRTDLIYLANSQDNSIVVITPEGKWWTLWENDDTDGADGGLDQPCEVFVNGDELWIVNFDFSFPGLKNQNDHDGVHTVSKIKLRK